MSNDKVSYGEIIANVRAYTMQRNNYEGYKLEEDASLLAEIIGKEFHTLYYNLHKVFRNMPSGQNIDDSMLVFAVVRRFYALDTVELIYGTTESQIRYKKLIASLKIMMDTLAAHFEKCHQCFRNFSNQEDISRPLEYVMDLIPYDITFDLEFYCKITYLKIISELKGVK